MTMFEIDENGVRILRVSAQSRTSSLAGAIAGIVREKGRVKARAIGAGAVNQAVKAIAIARGYLLLDGINVVALLSFDDLNLDGNERTAILFLIEPR